MINHPSPIPLGFYRHYKHNPKGEFANYTYEIIGIGMDTETRTYSVIYRPLYKNTFLTGADFCVRPYDMFIGDIEVDGKSVKRFVEIKDPEIISQLKKIREEMYGK